MKHKTIFSPCRKYRYTLWREFFKGWFEDVEPGEACAGNRFKYVQFIGLNPSTANETQDDPTIRRCIRFSKDWGYGAFCMTNLFGFCSAYPKEMMASSDPVGENDKYLSEIGNQAGLIIAAWGAFPCAIERGKNVRTMFSGRLHHLGLNSDGTPKHPLYLRADTKPTLWT